MKSLEKQISYKDILCSVQSELADEDGTSEEYLQWKCVDCAAVINSILKIGKQKHFVNSTKYMLNLPRQVFIL